MRNEYVDSLSKTECCMRISHTVENTTNLAFIKSTVSKKAFVLLTRI